MPKIAEARRDERRRAILDAALACFSENGFHQTGMADIVKRSGLSHGAVYLYFASKDDLIVALAVDRHRQEALLNAAASENGDPVAALSALIAAYGRSLADPSGEARRRVGVNGWAEALRSERVRASVLEGVAQPVAFIAALVERAQTQGRMAASLPPESVARAFVALFQGFLLQTVWGEPFDIEAALGVALRMLDGLMTTGQT